MAVSAPSDRRFRRAHVQPARRRGWRAIAWKAALRRAVVLGLVLYGAYRAADLALSADALTVSRLSVSGNARLSRGEVLSLLDGLQGQNMIAVDLDAWRLKLLASPWVADAALRRSLPGSVEVFIAERQPMGIARIGPALYLVDRQGDVIDEYGPHYADLDLPIVDGLAAADGRTPGLLVDAGRAALAARVLAELQMQPALAGRVSQVDVTDVRDATLILEGDSALVRVGDERFAERLQSYLDLAPALRERVPDIDYVDLRFGERVYVRPHRTGSRAQQGGRP
jgi:cell division protein FtsQ